MKKDRTWEFNSLLTCAGCLFIAANYIYEYKFSYMRIPTFIIILVFFVSLFYFLDTWFYYISGFLTGIVILISLMIGLLTSGYNNIAILFAALLSSFFLIDYGLRVYKKYKMTQDVE